MSTTCPTRIRLESAVDRRRRDGPLCPLPPYAARASLRLGDAAKLIFLDAAGRLSERIWVKVTARVDGRYVGRLANHPAVVPHACGDRVEFGPEHVAAITRDA